MPGHYIVAVPGVKTKCGGKQPHTGPYGRKVKWGVCILMSIFFGWLGVDRFMVGHIGMGLFKLLTFGGLGIWWFIDIILFATKQVQGVEWE